MAQATLGICWTQRPIGGQLKSQVCLGSFLLLSLVESGNLMHHPWWFVMSVHRTMLSGVAICQDVAAG
jgi:hypothetical protein